MQKFKQFRESGLGDMTSSNDVNNHRAEIVDELVEILTKNSEKLRSVWLALIDDFETDVQNDFKKVLGLIENLKTSPKKHNDKRRDPLSMVVSRGGVDAPAALSSESVTEEQKEELFKMARNYRQRSESAYKGFSGADRAEAPKYDILARACAKLGLGEDLEEVFRESLEKWKEYALENNAKVEKALKLKHGPSSGQSSIGYRWVSPESIESDLIHVRNMYKRIMNG